MREWLTTSLCVAVLLSSASAASTSQSEAYCFVGVNDLADPAAPKFEQYAVKRVPPSAAVKLDVESNPIAKSFRTVIRNEMSKGPNFAGLYRVVVWGCGTSCAQFAAVNLKTGRVITANGFEGVSGDHLSAEGFLPHTQSDMWGFRFRKDSRLFVVVGDLNEDESKQGAFYYILKDEKLELIHTTPAKRKTCRTDNE